jgi:putative hydrolase of the HAD superfamily
LWGDFVGEDPGLQALREWVPTYRREAWLAALREQGVEDPRLAAHLAVSFRLERRPRHDPFPDAEPTLRQLQGGCRLALVSNGAPDMQRLKLQESGLEGYFEAVVVSGDIGIGKPDARIFLHALALLEASPEGSVAVGDSIERDIRGAQRAGIRAIWLNRTGGKPVEGPAPDAEIASLSELPSLLA